MRRPNRVLCGITLGLAVLVGCGKKPKTEPSVPENTESATKPAGPGRTDVGAVGKVPVPVSPAPAPADTPSTGGTSIWGGSKPSPEPAAPVAVDAAGNVSIELTQCRFDKVESALASAKGKVVLVDCWARWCPPCIESFPKLVEKHEKYGPKGLVCVSVSLDSGRKAFNTTQVLAFLKEKKATFQNFYLTDLKADGATMDKRFGEISGIPHAVLINKKSEKVWEGHPLAADLVARIESELAK